MRIAEIFASSKKSGQRNTTVRSDFRPEVEIWPFCACAMQFKLLYRCRSAFVWQSANYYLSITIHISLTYNMAATDGVESGEVTHCTYAHKCYTTTPH